MNHGFVVRFAERLEDDAAKYWDQFYKRNGDRFFKDRHYFEREFPELLTPGITVLEVGCGAGNTVFPLMDLNPTAKVYACDFAETAVQIVQSHPLYASSGRAEAFVADLTSTVLTDTVPPASVDVATVVFVLSAICPEKMEASIDNIKKTLKPGKGILLFRDYAQGDLSQLMREESHNSRKIGENFYARGDGTRCYYFSVEELRAMFGRLGFRLKTLAFHDRLIENRKKEVKMRRRWIQATFSLDPDTVEVPYSSGWVPPLHVKAFEDGLGEDYHGLRENGAERSGSDESDTAPDPSEASLLITYMRGPADLEETTATAGTLPDLEIQPGWTVAVREGPVEVGSAAAARLISSWPGLKGKEVLVVDARDPWLPGLAAVRAGTARTVVASSQPEVVRSSAQALSYAGFSRSQMRSLALVQLDPRRNEDVNAVAQAGQFDVIIATASPQLGGSAVDLVGAAKALLRPGATSRLILLHRKDCDSVPAPCRTGISAADVAEAALSQGLRRMALTGGEHAAVRKASASGPAASRAEGASGLQQRPEFGILLWQPAAPLPFELVR